MVAGQTIDNHVRDPVAVSDSPLAPGRTGALRDFFRGDGVRRSFESLEVNIRYMRAESGSGGFHPDRCNCPGKTNRLGRSQGRMQKDDKNFLKDLLETLVKALLSLMKKNKAGDKKESGDSSPTSSRPFSKKNARSSRDDDKDWLKQLIMALIEPLLKGMFANKDGCKPGEGEGITPDSKDTHTLPLPGGRDSGPPVLLASASA